MSSPLFSRDFEIHAFEANPLFTNGQFLGYPFGVHIHRVAAWTTDGEIAIYVNRDKRLNVQGTSVFKEKITGNLDPDHPVPVKCIDFSTWLRTNFSLDDNILVKCNIEGAEYPLFRHMMTDGSIAFIKRLFLRVHWHKIGMPEDEHKEFMRDLEKVVPRLDRDYNFS
jgi:hypothetical protein